MIIGKKIISYKELDSTNDEAKRLINKGLGEGAVIVAGEQTRGKGKPGSSWFSAKGLGLYLSIILKPYKNPNDLAPLTLLGAKAVVGAIKEVAGITAEIKLPNDVLINGKKISGVLVERLASGHLVIGIGVNLNHDLASFPDEIRASATSLKIETNKNFSAEEFLDQLIIKLDQEYLAYLNNI